MMTSSEMEKRTVRFGDLIPCRTAFIDTHTPGSDLKENFTIIGGGVSESPDQHIHIKETPGFNIGAAGQPPHCFNSLHSHTTAEVFFVLKGTWRFFWGLHGDAGEVVLNEGDIFNIPTSVFRGFENVGTDYGMIMSILGGHDSGGGVTWAPHVLDTATQYGLLLDENGRLYDSKKGESIPEGINPISPISDEQLAQMKEPATRDVVTHYVKRYWDLMAVAEGQAADVISPDGMIKDRPGFEVDFIKRGSIGNQVYSTQRHEVLMVMRGHWKLSWDGGHITLAAGDTCAVPPQLNRRLVPSVSGEASLFRVRNTDDPAGPTLEL